MVTTTQNAVISSTELGTIGRGMTSWIHLDYSGAGQGFGGYALRGEYTDYWIAGILRALEVEVWEKLPGTALRVQINGGRIVRIGHYLKDQWFDPRQWDGGK